MEFEWKSNGYLLQIVVFSTLAELLARWRSEVISLSILLILCLISSAFLFNVAISELIVERLSNFIALFAVS